MTRHLTFPFLGFLSFVSCKTHIETVPFNGTQSNRPASEWEEAMLAGNGNMGDMMYGNSFDETIVGPKGKVGGCFSIDLTHKLIETETQVVNGEIKTHTTYVHGKGGYDNVVRIIPTGGEITNDNSSKTVSQADRILVVIQVDNWKTPLPESQSEVWAYSPKNQKF